MSDNKSNRKLAAIMFADIVSYSRLMGANETEAFKLVKDFDSISIPLVEKHDGKVIKKNGDQIFCEFSSVKNAVDASLLIQEKLHKYNDSRPVDFKLEVRIGIHIGDVIKENNDIFGDGVNVAARIQPLAAPGGISISGTVSEALSSHPEYKLVAKGEQELKNIVNKHSIYNVETGYETVDIVRGPLNSPKSFSAKLFLLVLSVGALASILFFLIDDSLTNEEERKGFFVGKVLSYDTVSMDFDLINFLQSMGDEKIKKFFDADDAIELRSIDKNEKTLIYDEIITNLNFDDDEYFLKTHYDYVDACKSTGSNIANYNEIQIYNIATRLIGLAPGGLDKVLDENYNSSIFEIINSSSSLHLGIAPIIYEIYKNNKPSGDYIASLAFIEFIRNDNDGTMTIGLDGDSFITQRDLISSQISYFANKHIRNHIGVFDESRIKISSISEDEYIIKFSKEHKPRLKKRMILSAEREFIFNGNNKDSLATIRYDELVSYKLNVDNNKNSILYTDFYRKDNPSWSNDELVKMSEGIWFSNHDEGALNIELGITIKIIEVYDSTATGIIYNKENPYIDLKIGDNLIY